MLDRTPVVKLPPSMVSCNLLHLHYICHNMLAEDIEQYLILMALDEYKPDQAACYFHSLAGPRMTLLGNDGMPFCSGGYYEIFPGVFQSWMVGTAWGWETSWRTLTKGSLWLMSHLFDHFGARRLQTSVLASREATIRWYCKSLKMQPQGVWEKYGRRGEALAHFARLADPVVGED